MSTRTIGAIEPRTAGVKQGLVIVLTGLVPILVVFVPPPILPNMVAAFQNIPRPATMVPLVVALPGLLVAIFSWFAGSLIDRYGRRKPFILATAFFILLGVLPALAGSFASVTVSRVGIGIAQSVVMVASSALLIDYFAEHQRRSWLTAQGIAAALLQPAVAVLAGMAGGYGWQYAFLLYGLAIPILIGAVLFCFEPKIDAADTGPQVDIRPFPIALAGLMSAVTLLASIFFFLFLVHAGIVLKEVGIESSSQIGNLIGLTTLGFPIGVVVFNIGSRKLPINGLLALLILLMSLGTLGIGLSSTATEMVAFGFLQQIGVGMTVPTLISWVAGLFLPEHRGRGFGLFNGMLFLGQFLCAPMLNLAEIATGGVQSGFFVLGCIGVLGAGLTLFVTRPKTPAGLAALQEQAVE